jgi:two-component system sensor histidine kinase UhpB
VAEIRQLLGAEMLGLRRLMTELRPPVIDERGLHAALTDCARQVLEGSGAELELRLGLGDVRLAREVETVVYRVVREALVNTVRHGAASRVEVALEPGHEGFVRLLVADDGRGFSEDEVRGREGDHYGLLGMQERVESIAGAFRVRSAPGEGTRVEAILPLKSAR